MTVYYENITGYENKPHFTEMIKSQIRNQV